MRVLPRLSVLPLLLAASLHAPAQPIDEPADSGQPSARSLRNEIRNAERDMFALFNKLNSDDELDVACGYSTPTRSKIPVWHCEPAFMRIAEGAEFMQMKDNMAPASGDVSRFGYLPRDRDGITFIVREKQEQLQNRLRTLAQENPELASAIVALHDLRQQLAAIEGASAQ